MFTVLLHEHTRISRVCVCYTALHKNKTKNNILALIERKKTLLKKRRKNPTTIPTNSINRDAEIFIKKNIVHTHGNIRNYDSMKIEREKKLVFAHTKFCYAIANVLHSIVFFFHSNVTTTTNHNEDRDKEQKR